MPQSNGPVLSFPVHDSIFFTQADKEIEQIDEIELTPYIQIQEVAEEVIVSGHLQLEGRYAGKESSSPDLFLNEGPAEKVGYTESFTFNPFAMDAANFSEETELLSFEHRIPVHIRIPRDKIVDLDQLYATIESFDYDIQSSRKLSISAELVLNGITNGEVAEEEEEAAFPVSFEYVAAKDLGSEKERDPIPEHEVTGMAFEAMRKREEQLEKDRAAEATDEPAEKERTEEMFDEDAAAESAGEAERKAVEKEREEERIVAVKEEKQEEQRTEAVREDEEEEAEEQEEQQEEQEEQPALENEEEREEEKKEAKVAITLKGTKQDPVTVSPSTLASYLHPEERTEETAVEYEDREASLENEREERWGNEEDETKDAALYLTNFMNKTEESYTRLKMCIAQKDETLDGIAERYDITPTDIALANGLHTNATIAKGQVLYIPVKS